MSYKFALTINTNDTADIAKIVTALGSVDFAALTGSFTAASPTVDEDDSAPAATVAPGETDTSGLPWDLRIHSGKKSKNSDGTWRKVKNVDAGLVTAVEAELRALASPNVSVAPIPVPVGATPAVAPVPPAVPVSAAPTPPAAPATPPTPPAAPAAPATPTAPTLDFGGLMQVVSNGMTAVPVLIDDAFIAWLNSTLGVTQLPEIANDPAKIAQAYQLLVDHKRVVGL